MHITEIEAILRDGKATEDQVRRLAEALMFERKRPMHSLTQEQLNRAYGGCGCSGSWDDAARGALG